MPAGLRSFGGGREGMCERCDTGGIWIATVAPSDALIQLGVCEVVVTKAADEPSCVGVGHGYLWLKSFIRDDQVYFRSCPE